MDDNKIVELYLSRNEDAINQTAHKYGSSLRHIANSILNDRETAKECEDDAYLEAWELIPPHEPRNYLFVFVGKIVRHIALNVCKKNGRQKRYALYCELTQEMQECIPAENDTETEIEAEYLNSLIDEFLSVRSKEQRNVFAKEKAEQASSGADSKPKLSLMAGNAGSMSKSAQALMQDSLWEKKTIKEKDAKTGEETEKEDYDWKAITKALKSFIDDYNATVEGAGESNNRNVLRNAAWMTKTRPLVFGRSQASCYRHWKRKQSKNPLSSSKGCRTHKEIP